MAQSSTLPVMGDTTATWNPAQPSPPQPPTISMAGKPANPIFILLHRQCTHWMEMEAPVARAGVVVVVVGGGGDAIVVNDVDDVDGGAVVGVIDGVVVGVGLVALPEVHV